MRHRAAVAFWHLRQIPRGIWRLVRLPLHALATGFWALVLLAAAWLSRRFRGGQRLYWGPEPLINNKYWSDAMRGAGFDSTSVTRGTFENFASAPFDLLHEQILAESRLPGFIARRAPAQVVFMYVLRNFDIVHLPFTGGPLGKTALAGLEPRLLRLAGIRSVLIPYGGDLFRYSWISEALVRHAMLLDYPEAGRSEDLVEKRVKRWMRHADVVQTGFMIEGVSRWDVIPSNGIIIDRERVMPRESWGSHDGKNGPVTILHAPNHRGVKGSAFIIDAVEELKKSYEIDLVLLERRPNHEVLEAMRGADICIDHCIGSGYGLFAIEAMASGSVVMANLEDEQRLGVHRHYGWLNQCPIVSANIDQLVETIEYLIGNPAEREQLGRMGIEFTRRFHGPEMAQHLYGSIYRSFAGEEVDLLTLFHPGSEFMSRFEPLRPPLRRNRPMALLR